MQIGFATVPESVAATRLLRMPVGDTSLSAAPRSATL